VLLAFVLVPASSSSAQELRGRITGVVTDNTGAVLPGVAVTAAGPALIQAQTTVTGGDGTYRYPALPPGLYTLTFELSGFQTLKRSGWASTRRSASTFNCSCRRSRKPSRSPVNPPPST
jgi:hypothetical protein